ncbi:hypothetical protein ABBQ32_011342 [Trebouxia sp. C0010 RCD-2024]
MQPVNDFKDDWSDSRWVGHPGGAWGAVPMSAHRRDPPPFIPQGGPGNPLQIRVATPGIGIPSRTEPIINDEDDDDSEQTVSDDDGEVDDGITVYNNQLFEPVSAEETEPVPKPMTAEVGTSYELKAPSLADAYTQTDRYLEGLVESVHEDNGQADKLNQVPGPTPEEEPKPVHVLDPVTAGVANAVARGDHASVVALLKGQMASKKAKDTATEEAERNELYRLGLLKQPRWEPGANPHRDEPYKIRAARAPLNPDARGVQWVDKAAKPKRAFRI